MPSPFPGMDPWLEGDVWSSVHYDLCSAIAHQLVPRLVPKYFAVPARRNVWEGRGEIDIAPTSYTVPDVGVFPLGGTGPGNSTAVLPMTPTNVSVETIVAMRVPHFVVEVRDVRDRKLVTMIEVMSPAKKQSPGHEQYLVKRSRILRSKVHLLEIDLLRQGRRIPTRKLLPEAPYFVFLNRAGRRPRKKTDVWPIVLASPLPTVPVPLQAPDEDVPLDLQSALNVVYDALGFRYIVRYDQPPDVPLSDDERNWADARLREAGLRV